MKSLLHPWSGATASLLLFTVADSPAAPRFTTVALAGEVAPGGDPGLTYSDLFQGSPPVLDNTGRVLFTAVFAGSEVTTANDRALVVGQPGSLEVLAREGEIAPDTTAQFSDFLANRAAMTDTGLVLIDADLTGTDVDSTNNHGMWVGTQGSLTLLLRTGDPAPDLGPSVTISSLRLPLSGRHVLTPDGRTATNLLLTGSGVSSSNNEAIVAGTAAAMSLIAREGSQAPGAPPGAGFDDLFNSYPAIEEGGRITFQSQLAGTGITTANDYGLWFGLPGTLDLPLREPHPAPGVMGADLVFFNPPVINRLGHVAFSGAVTGPGIDASNDYGVWAGPPAGLSLVAREGFAAPETSGALFGDFLTIDPFLNNLGEVAFNANLTGPGVDASNDSGIWAGTTGDLRLIAREGSPAPDTAEGVTFDSFRFFLPLLNSAGQVLVSGELSGPGVNNANDAGLWLTEAQSGTLRLLLREGDVIEVAPGDMRTVRQIKGIFGGGDGDGGTTALNNNGAVVMAVVFSDFTTAILLAEPEEPPRLSIHLEPTGLVLSWDAEGYTLQTAPTLEPTDWLAAPVQDNPQTIPLEDPARFYRLIED